VTGKARELTVGQVPCASPIKSDIPDQDRLFFDAHVRIGARGAKHAALRWRLDQLIAEMEQCSISAALVWSFQSVRYDAMFGNRELVSQLSEYQNLFAGWNVLPHGTGEFPHPAELVREMRQAGVRACCIHPRTNAWDLFGDHVRPLFDELRAHKIPCFLHRAEIDSWRQLDLFLENNRGLAVVLSGAGWSEQRYMIPLLRKYSDLHVTLESAQINRGIEDLCAWGHSGQVLFGTNAPAMSMGAHRCYVDYAEATGLQKSAVASGNLMRLLGVEKPPELHSNPNDDVFMAAAKAGRPMPGGVIDMHMHILHEGLNGGGGHFRMSNGGPISVFEQLQRMGAVGGGFMSWNGTVGGDSVAGNHCVQVALDAAPPGYWGLATFDPCHYSADKLGRMIPSFYESDPRFIGMKPYFLYGVEYHHRSYDLWWNFGNEHGFYAGLHRVRNDYQEVECLAERYPNVRWVVFHCGSDYAAADGVIECIRRFPNVYAEITFTSVTSGIIEYLVEHAGAERVLYGSDLPMRDPTPQLGWVVFSRLNLSDKIRILRENALKTIEPCIGRLPTHNRPALPLGATNARSSR